MYARAPIILSVAEPALVLHPLVQAAMGNFKLKEGDLSSSKRFGDYYGFFLDSHGDAKRVLALLVWQKSRLNYVG